MMNSAEKDKSRFGNLTAVCMTTDRKLLRALQYKLRLCNSYAPPRSRRAFSNEMRSPYSKFVSVRLACVNCTITFLIADRLKLVIRATLGPVERHSNGGCSSITRRVL